MSQLLHIQNSKSKVLIAGILFLIVIVDIIVFAQVSSTDSLFASDTPTPDAYSSYAPVAYGLPDTIGGYKILAVRTLDNTACMLAGSYRLVLQAAEPTVEDFLGSTIGVDGIQQTLAQMDVPQPTRWELSFVGPGVTIELILSESEKWNAQFGDGNCVRLGGPAIIAGTPTPP